jgi:hypothetical protein
MWTKKERQKGRKKKKRKKVYFSALLTGIRILKML